MNQKNLQMACFVLAEDVPGLTPEALEKALMGIADGPKEIWLTRNEAAAMIGVDSRTLNRKREEYKLKWVRRGYRNVRISKSSVMAYLAECENFNRFANMGPNARRSAA